MDSKMRVWHIPQVGYDATFYVPVETVEEGFKVMTILAAYDGFQFENRVKPDYCNATGLQVWDDDSGDWVDWDMETDDDYFDDPDTYCQSDACPSKDALSAFADEVLSNWYKCK